MNLPKVGVLDLETAPIEGLVWGLFDQTIGLNQITTEWSILSFAFKEVGAPKKSVLYMDTFDKADKRDDQELCAKLWEIIHEYDIIVGQNAKRFDKRKLYARLIMHGFPPPSPVKIEDTMLMARQVAAFTSNKLAWLSQHLTDTKKSSHSKFPGMELWNEYLAGNPHARVAMKKYNILDIIATEELYCRLRPWVRGHSNVAVYTDDERMACPVCGGNKLKEDGFSYTNVGKYQRYQCAAPKCGAWSRSRHTLNTLAKRKALLSN